MEKFLTYDMSTVTPLHQAVYCGDIAEVNRLIDAKVLVDAKDDKHRTPLHLAVFKGHAEIARILLKADANVNAKAIDGWTPLHVAAWKDKHQIAHILIDEGACLHLRGYYDRKTPLDVAIYYHGKDSEIARLLREAMEKQGG